MANGFYIDPNSVKQGKMKDFYDTIAKLGGEVDKVDTQTEKEAYKAALTAALAGATTDEAKAELGFDQDDVNAIFGLQKSETQQTAGVVKNNETKTVTTPEFKATKPAQLSNKDKKAVDKDVREAVERLIGQGFSGKELVEKLKEQFAVRYSAQELYKKDEQGNPVINPLTGAYEIDESEHVVGEIKRKEFKNMTTGETVRVLQVQPMYQQSIEEAEKLILKAAAGEKIEKKDATKLQKNLADSAEQMKKDNEVATFRPAINYIYDKVKGTSADFEKTYKKMEAMLNDSQFTYIEQIQNKVDLETDPQNYKPKENKHEITKEVKTLLVKDLEKEIQNDAVKYVYLKCFDPATGSLKPEFQADSHRKIRTKMREALGASNDKFISNAIQELKLDRKISAREYKVNERSKELASIKAEDLKSDLVKLLNDGRLDLKPKRHAEEIMRKLSNAYASKFDASGKPAEFNLANLSRDIMTRVGKNWQVDREDGDKTVDSMAEKQQIKNFIEAQTGQKFTDTEIKVLIKLAAIPIQGRDRSIWHVLGIPDATAAGGAAGAVGGYLAAGGYRRMTDFEENIVQASALEQAKANIVKNGGTYSVTDLGNGMFSVKQVQQMSVDESLDNALAGMVNGLAIGAAIDMLARYAFGGDRYEQTCMNVADYDPHSVRYTDANKYKIYIANKFKHNPVKAEAIQLMIDKYVAAFQENWHVEFQRDLRAAAGFGSTLNPEECRRHFFTPRDIKNPDPVCKIEYFKLDGEKDKKYDFEPQKNNFAHWDDGVNGYECLQDYNQSIDTGRRNKQGEKIFVKLNNRMIKVIQAINPEAAKSDADIQKLYQISTIAAFAKDTIEHGVDYAIEHHPELPINKQDLQNALGGSPTKGKTFTPVLYNGETPCNWAEPSTKAHINKGSAKGADISDKSAHYFKAGTKDRFYKQDCKNKTEEITEDEYNRNKNN